MMELHDVRRAIAAANKRIKSVSPSGDKLYCEIELEDGRIVAYAAKGHNVSVWRGMRQKPLIKTEEELIGVLLRNEPLPRGRV